MKNSHVTILYLIIAILFFVDAIFSHIFILHLFALYFFLLALKQLKK